MKKLFLVIFLLSGCIATGTENRNLMAIKRAKLHTGCDYMLIKDRLDESRGTTFAVEGCNERVMIFCDSGSFTNTGFEIKC